MAKRITVALVDDYDGKSDADESINFGLDGVNYEIDLSDANAAQLRKDLNKWIEHARRVGGRTIRRRPSVSTSVRGDSREIREWARANGYELSSRGRVRADIVRAFNAAQEQPAETPAPKKATRKVAARKKSSNVVEFSSAGS